MDIESRITSQLTRVGDRRAAGPVLSEEIGEFRGHAHAAWLGDDYLVFVGSAETLGLATRTRLSRRSSPCMAGVLLHLSRSSRRTSSSGESSSDS